MIEYLLRNCALWAGFSAANLSSKEVYVQLIVEEQEVTSVVIFNWTLLHSTVKVKAAISAL